MNLASNENDDDRTARRLAMATGRWQRWPSSWRVLLVHRRFGELGLSTDDAYIYTGYVKMAFTPGAGLFSYNVGEHSAGTIRRRLLPAAAADLPAAASDLAGG